MVEMWRPIKSFDEYITSCVMRRKRYMCKGCIKSSKRPGLCLRVAMAQPICLEGSRDGFVVWKRDAFSLTLKKKRTQCYYVSVSEYTQQDVY